MIRVEKVKINHLTHIMINYNKDTNTIDKNLFIYLYKTFNISSETITDSIIVKVPYVNSNSTIPLCSTYYSKDSLINNSKESLEHIYLELKVDNSTLKNCELLILKPRKYHVIKELKLYKRTFSSNENNSILVMINSYNEKFSMYDDTDFFINRIPYLREIISIGHNKNDIFDTRNSRVEIEQIDSRLMNLELLHNDIFIKLNDFDYILENPHSLIEAIISKYITENAEYKCIVDNTNLVINGDMNVSIDLDINSNYDKFKYVEVTSMIKNVFGIDVINNSLNNIGRVNIKKNSVVRMMPSIFDNYLVFDVEYLLSKIKSLNTLGLIYIDMIVYGCVDKETNTIQLSNELLNVILNK